MAAVRDIDNRTVTMVAVSSTLQVMLPSYRLAITLNRDNSTAVHCMVELFQLVSIVTFGVPKLQNLVLLTGNPEHTWIQA